MKERSNNFSEGRASNDGERGVSIVELLIVVVMVSVVTGFAIMQIARANRTVRLNNSAREFMGYLEKARVDSVRRHAMSNLEMASVTIASANSYTVTIDQNGDGTLDPPRTITIPTTNGETFANITIPTTIRYNWRGRPVDSLGSSLDLAFVLRDSSNNVNSINVTSGGDASLGNSPATSNVTVTGISATANIKGKTYGP